MGGTYRAEIQRSAEEYLRINEEQGALLALYYLHDLQYNHKDIKNMLSVIADKREFWNKREA